jgi:hypothetical protein
MHGSTNINAILVSTKEKALAVNKVVIIAKKISLFCELMILENTYASAITSAKKGYVDAQNDESRSGFSTENSGRSMLRTEKPCEVYKWN